MFLSITTNSNFESYEWVHLEISIIDSKANQRTYKIEGANAIITFILGCKSPTRLMSNSSRGH